MPEPNFDPTTAQQLATIKAQSTADEAKKEIGELRQQMSKVVEASINQLNLIREQREKMSILEKVPEILSASLAELSGDLDKITKRLALLEEKFAALENQESPQEKPAFNLFDFFRRK